MTANSNVIDLKTGEPANPLSDTTRQLLVKISMKISNGCDLTTAEQSAVHIYFPSLIAQVLTHEKRMDALFHRIKTSCAQEGIDPARLIGTELAEAG